MLFSWPVLGCKLIFVFILPSNTHFPENKERAEWEGDRPARREWEEEETELRRTQKPTSTNPENLRPSSLRRSHHRRDRRTTVPIHPKPIILVSLQNRSSSTQICCPRSRSRLRTDRDRSCSTNSSSPITIVAPQNQSSLTQILRPRSRFVFAPIVIVVAAPIRRPRSRSSHPKTDRPRPQNRSSSLSSFFSQFDRIMNFFFWVLFVFLDWGMKLYIYLAAEKMWATSRKCVFYDIFNNTTKH